MSKELLEFSELIDQQFEVAEAPDENLVEMLLNLFE